MISFHGSLHLSHGVYDVYGEFVSQINHYFCLWITVETDNLLTMTSLFFKWVSNNKLVAILSITTLSFFVCTVALSARKTSKLCELVDSEAHKKMNKSTLNFTRSYHSTKEINNYRLSRDVKPLNYTLRLQPNLSDKTFEGNVQIKILVLNPVYVIEFHKKDLNIKSVSIKNTNGEMVIINSTRQVNATDTFQFQFVDKIAVGYYELSVEFSGKLDKGIVGLYASTMKNGDTMVASKFQPTYARQAFPCFDEPEFKATYDITLVKPIDYVALSNMNEISRTLDQRTKTEAVTFATSVPMSTYLACFVICNFDFKETTINANGIGKNFTLRSFAQKDQTHQIDFAQDIGKRATEFYIQYYEVPFPLPKLDMIAIPDYVSGATEHWGLITYRETSFLVDEAKASSKNKIGVANTIAHELAHMWFGNLVTMKWWDEVWLNEGFASYMQVKALNAIEPSWTMLDQFLTKTLHSVLVTDAKLSSHPIVQTVETPDQITAIFDSISYNKGASILRMLEGFIGEENFRKGVSEYLQKYKFGNTVTRELLMSLEPHFKKDYPSLSLQYIMDTWTKQMGYPVITVTAGDNNNKYILTQSRFLLDKNATYADDSEYHYKWLIPITYTTNKGKHQSILWFLDSAEKVELTLSAEDEWLKINNNQVGYYRVNYPIDMWENLIRQLTLKSEKLTISDRAHLLNDAFALSEAGHLPYNIALNLTTYLIEEKDYVPWDGAASTLSKLSDRLFATPAHDNLKKYIQHLIKHLYLEQSWEKTNLGVIEGLLRTRVLSLATANGLSDAENKVRELFLTWLNSYGTVDAVTVEPDLRDFVYYQGMKSGSEEEWDKLWRIYIKEEDVQEQTKIRTALSAPKNTGILRKYLDLAWDEKNIRSQDYLNVLQLISGNPSGTALVWDQVRSNWPQLVERFTLNSRYLGNLIPGITSTFNTERRLQEMEAFFEKYPEAGAGATARKSALETVRNNIKWASSYQDVVASWLENRIKMFE